MTHAALIYWFLLTEAEQREAIRRMSREGMSVDVIAQATQLSVEVVREVLESPAGQEGTP